MVSVTLGQAQSKSVAEAYLRNVRCLDPTTGVRALPMQNLKKLDKWVKRNISSLTLIGLAISIISFPFGYTLFAIQEQHSIMAQKIQESQRNAEYRSLVDRMNGGIADPFQDPDGLYHVGFRHGTNLEIHLTASVSYVITRANGTAELPSQQFR